MLQEIFFLYWTLEVNFGVAGLAIQWLRQNLEHLSARSIAYHVNFSHFA